MKKTIILLLAAAGCRAEFDLGTTTPRRDPCTGRTDRAAVYIQPACPLPTPPPPPAETER